MSLFGTMKTAVSGMNAQANRLGTVGDNIANANTTAYKRASTQFSSLVLPSTAGSYTSGGVETNVRYAVSEQGNLRFTNSATDIAIKGEGFYVVQDAQGNTFMTRAGSFTVDENGNLTNAAGYTLMGYDFATGTPAAVVNGFDGLAPINMGSTAISAKASTGGIFAANLDARKSIVAAANLPSTNSATAEYSHKSSLVAYDSLGKEVLYDFYYTKTSATEWEVSVFRKDQASASGNGFPYTGGPLATTTITFDPTTGNLQQAKAGPPPVAASNTDITFTDATNPLDSRTLKIDFTGMSQLAYDFTAVKASVDGNKPSEISAVAIDNDGTIYAVYTDGSRSPRYRLALATVQSPDNLVLQNGNVYSQSGSSGVVRTGFPGDGDFGVIIAGALEDSNVDMASELTEMIEAQRSYTANSKVFQTGSDLMDVLINLKR